MFGLNGVDPELRIATLAQDASKGKKFLREAPDFVLSSVSAVEVLGSKRVEVSVESFQQVRDEFLPNFLVVDAEGYEVELLMGAAFDGIEMLLVEMHPSVVGLPKIVDLCHWIQVQGFLMADYSAEVVLFVRR